jgi:hypothetical protein
MLLVPRVYEALATDVAAVDGDDAWAPTGCLGWAVRDLVFHLRADCLRALVAVHNPLDRSPDTDEVSYWAGWGSDAQADELNRRHTRMEAGHYPWPLLRTMYGEANAAAVRAVAGADPATVVLTQGHALTVEHLASTLVVEATLHHVDLVVHLRDARGPTDEGLAETRRVCEALLGRSLPSWSDQRVALVATGRAEATSGERAALGEASVPVFT